MKSLQTWFQTSNVPVVWCTSGPLDVMKMQFVAAPGSESYLKATQLPAPFSSAKHLAKEKMRTCETGMHRCFLFVFCRQEHIEKRSQTSFSCTEYCWTRKANRHSGMHLRSYMRQLWSCFADFLVSSGRIFPQRDLSYMYTHTEAHSFTFTVFRGAFTPSPMREAPVGSIS